MDSESTTPPTTIVLESENTTSCLGSGDSHSSKSKEIMANLKVTGSEWKKELSKTSSNAGTKLQNVTSSASTKIQNATSQAGTKIQDFSATAGPKIRDFSASAGSKIQDLSAQAGQRMQSMSHKVKKEVKRARSKSRERVRDLSREIQTQRFISDGVLRVPIRRFDVDSVKVSLNKAGSLVVNASCENVEETGRHGERKVFTQIEETCQLPSYLVDNDMLSEVECKILNGFLVTTYPLNPTVEVEDDGPRDPTGPIPVQIKRIE